MNSNICNIPSQSDRSDTEFDRTGSSAFLRAGDEAAAIWDDKLSGADRASLSDRVERLHAQVRWLETWRYDDCQDLLRIGSCWMPLSIAPEFLRALVDAMPEPRARPILRLVQ